MSEYTDYEEISSETGLERSHLFTKGGRNGKEYEIWDEESVHEVLDRLEDWLCSNQKITEIDKKGNVIELVGRPNLFYQSFLREQGLYRSWISYVTEKFESVSERMKDIDAIQADRINEGAIFGDLKENFSKFFLMAKHGYSERLTTDNTNKNEPLVWAEEKTYINEKDKDNDV